MAFEMICGQCRGNLLVEQFGVVVACPHCGAHLHIPAPETPAVPAAPAPLPIAPTPSVPEQLAPIPIPVPPSFTTPAIETSTATASAIAESSLPASASPEPQAVQNGIGNGPVAGQAPESSDRPTPTVTAESAAPSSSIFDFGGGSMTTAPSRDEPPVTPPATSIAAPQTFGSGVALDALFGASPSVAKTPPPIEPVPASTAPPLSESPASPASTETAVAAAATPIVESTGLSAILGTASAAPASADASTGEPPAAVSAVDVPASTSQPLATTDSVEPVPVVPPPTDATPPARRDHVTISKTALMMLLSYASAITLGFVWLVFRVMAPQNHGLESLPDIEPRKSAGKQVVFELIPENAEMPPNHELAIGDSQRFGNVKVTVMKVTRGPIKFSHFSRNEKKARFPTAPVLKLWLKFANVSEDQEIAPLNGLLFIRNRKTERANQFLCRARDKANGKKILMYDHAVQGEWDLAGLSLDKEIPPQGSREYYLPSSENYLDNLKGDLLWRVHFRKGYSAHGYGVTTVIEVHFDSQDIQEETA